jgi:Domain of unknown function (DUF4259)
MGAWGTAAFDNDDASDWVYELEKSGLAAVEAAIADALRATDLETPVDTNAIAAGEVVAAALGRPAATLPDDVQDVVERLAGMVTAEHARRARAAVEGVLESSELAELWAESDEEAAWRSGVEDLLVRLRP